MADKANQSPQPQSRPRSRLHFLLSFRFLLPLFLLLLSFLISNRRFQNFFIYCHWFNYPFPFLISFQQPQIKQWPLFSGVNCTTNVKTKVEKVERLDYKQLIQGSETGSTSSSVSSSSSSATEIILQSWFTRLNQFEDWISSISSSTLTSSDSISSPSIIRGWHVQPPINCESVVIGTSSGNVESYHTTQSLLPPSHTSSSSSSFPPSSFCSRRSLLFSPLILYFHGNAENRAYPATINRYSVFTSAPLCAHVLVFDYRGFADSDRPQEQEEEEKGKGKGKEQKAEEEEEGEVAEGKERREEGEENRRKRRKRGRVGPTMQTTLEDVVAVYRFALNQIGGDVNEAAKRVIIYGHSLGTGVASQLLHYIHHTSSLSSSSSSLSFLPSPSALILESPFLSIPAVVSSHLSFLPFSSSNSSLSYFTSLLTDIYPSSYLLPKAVDELNIDVLILHGRKDSVVPMEQGEELWKLISERRGRGGGGGGKGGGRGEGREKLFELLAEENEKDLFRVSTSETGVVTAFVSLTNVGHEETLQFSTAQRNLHHFIDYALTRHNDGRSIYEQMR